MNENILKLPSVAILVDCWDMSKIAQGNYNEAFEVVYANIIDFIDNTPEITIIILASFDADDLGLDYNNVWYETARKILPRSNKTSKKILDYVNKDKLQVATTSFDDFTGLLNKHPEIENIYFMGATWHDCIQNRPIGIRKCSNVGKNILINTDCVWHSVDSAGLDLTYNNQYSKITDNIYQLVKQE